jgi:spoIIIJ-associated protein
VFSACRALGIDEKDAQVQVISAPGARRVKVRVGRPGVAMPAAGAPAAEEPATRPSSESGGSRSFFGAGASERQSSPAAQAPMLRVPPSPGQVESVRSDLVRLLELMGTPGTVEVKERLGNVVLNVVADKEPLLVGHRGATLEALYAMALEFLHRQSGDPSLHVVVDVADHHGRQEIRLIERAKEVAARVIESGQEEAMGTLSAAERRVVHMTLKELGGVESFSVGSGNMKKLVVQKR